MGVARGAQITSNAVTITGLGADAPVTVVDGEYSIGCTATFKSATGTIGNGQAVCVRHVSSPAFNTQTITGLTIGDATAAFASRTAANSNPVADAGADQVAVVGTATALSGAGSTDPDNEALSYEWRILSRPPDSLATLTSTTSVATSLTPDVKGIYRIELTVRDASGSGPTDEVILTAPNRSPTIGLVADSPIDYEQAPIFLTATATDADGDALTYEWSQTEGPSGQLISDGAPTTTQEFWAPAITDDTSVRIQVQARDSDGAIATATIGLQLLAYNEIGGPIFSNTTWASPNGRPFEVVSKVSVAPGATLTVAPGTVIRLRRLGSSSELAVVGALVAEGSASQLIFFERLNPRNHLRWIGFSFEGNAPSARFSHVVIDGASIALNLLRGPNPSLIDTVMRACDMAVQGGNFQPIVWDHITMLRNGVGFVNLQPAGQSSITNSLFLNNQNLMEQPTGVNDLFAFTSSIFTSNGIALYAPKTGFGHGTITATDNYWGTTDASAISAVIVDRNDDATLNEIPFQPALSAAPQGAGARFNPEAASSPPLQ